MASCCAKSGGYAKSTKMELNQILLHFGMNISPFCKTKVKIDAFLSARAEGARKIPYSILRMIDNVDSSKQTVAGLTGLAQIASGRIFPVVLGVSMSDCFVGQISLFSFSFAPKFWAQCSGQTMAISQNNALFALLGAAYGGDGISNFKLPDLRGRVPIGFGTSAQSGVVAIGQAGGSETVTLAGPTLPGHNHSLNASSQTANRRIPSGRLLATDTSTNADYYAPPQTVTALSPTSIGATGDSAPHENRQPYLTINYCIALSGIFPSRN